ncbi:hypothetical protein CmeUKMEL1_04790 [Cryptosporidium meleagridis]|uniref:Uncharacterized protein n=1 Tax=Cryptosporidium meleagridis TaxID=93969 RepID=A0A2P4YYN1_9CRYT|nr:hypothetical protein CmeUKMEL1_04790 [Cryptosporidium meleagridis]
MASKTNISIIISDFIWNTYYDLISSIFYGKKYHPKSPRPKFTVNKVVKLVLWLLGWLSVTFIIPLCGIILAYSISPSRVDIVPAVFEKNYLVISKPLLRTNSQSSVVNFTTSISFLFDIKYVNRLFVDKIMIEGIEIAYIGRIPVDSNNKSNCNSDNLDYLFPDFTKFKYKKIPDEMIDFTCTNDYKNCTVSINIQSFFIDSYDEYSYNHDSGFGYSNFVIRTSFTSSQFISTLVSGRLGYRYNPLSIPIKK